MFVYYQCIIPCVAHFPGPMSKWNTYALIKLTGKLKLNVGMFALAYILEKPAGGFMSRSEAQSVRAKIGEQQQMEQVIDILLGNGDIEFAVFCKLLRLSNYEAWARQLELEAERFKTSLGMKHHLPFLPSCCYVGL